MSDSTLRMFARAATWAVVATVGSLAMPMQVLAQATPKPPSKICIDDAESCAEVPAVGGIKWHPGHYMQVLRGSVDVDQSKRFGYYDQIASNANIVGVGVFFRWSQLEGAKGDYSSGIALVKSEISKLKSLAVPKRLAIRVMDTAYGGTCPAASVFPDYLDAAGKLIQTKSQCAWKRWDAETMGWFIDMMNAYAAAFDSDPYVEMISPFHETSIGWAGGSPPAEFSEAKLDVQYRRLALALKTAWKSTNVWMPTNFGLNGSTMVSYIGYLGSISVGAGNPDVCPSCGMTVDLVLAGLSGLVDYRGRIPHAMSVEVSELGYDAVGPTGGFTAQEIADYVKSQGVTHMFWDRNTVTGTAEQRWDTGILPIINKQAMLASNCPSAYSSCLN